MSNETVLVTGDFVLDHHIYEGRRHDFGDIFAPGVRLVRTLGGAAVVHQLLEKLLESDKGATPSGWTSRLAVKEFDSPDSYGPNAAYHAYAFWRPHPANEKPEKQYWRVSEAMGFGDLGRTRGGKSSRPPWSEAPRLPAKPRVIAISEGGIAFRDDKSRWKKLNFGGAEWIVLKTAAPIEGPRGSRPAPLTTSELWRTLVKHRERLIVVVGARELRRSVAQISAGLSWEETLENLLRELEPGGALESLTQCRHLIVTFDCEGGAWIDMGDRAGGKHDADPTVHFVYDAASIEGELIHSLKGATFGVLSCVAAAVVWQVVLRDPKKRDPDLNAALERGLSAMRSLREDGHGPFNSVPDGFPAKRLADVVKHPRHSYSRAMFPLAQPSAARIKASSDVDTAAPPRWSLLLESQRKPHLASDLARLVVVRGPVALGNLPHLSIGKLIAVDRGEIESLRTLIHSIRSYQRSEAPKRPLSIGVFGPPGAGKSFAVAELAEHLAGKDAWMEFNLSQFAGTRDLIGAFHQIRDRVLQGILPVAFFDEFDSQEYKWLQYLLAPMQDGKFQEGQITHTLGKCIFVVAGGTSWTFDSFGPPEPNDGKASDEYDAFRLAKGPDFKSRIEVYLDVAGPNGRPLTPPPANAPHQKLVSGHLFAENENDPYSSIRRALMIRSELKCAPSDRIEIDERLLDALLKVSRYTHGSRSLSKIIQALRPALPGSIHRSLLPPLSQLKMHTDIQSFTSFCDDASPRAPRPDELKPVRARRMAGVIHNSWRVLGKKEGWLKAGNKINKPFKSVDSFHQESNVAAAARMPRLLALVGLRLAEGAVKTENQRREEAQVRQRLEYHLDLLAEAEHEGWMLWHLGKGWRYSPTRDDDRMLHNALVPFSQLKDVDKNKDRNTIRKFPDYAREAGMRIVLTG